MKTIEEGIATLAALAGMGGRLDPAGGPVEVVVAQTVAEHAEISVTDHGLGIPPENRKQIFERFHQAATSGRRSGLGLGLYISRRIAELHHGDIHAEFPLDGGTCVVLRLPLHRVDTA